MTEELACAEAPRTAVFKNEKVNSINSVMLMEGVERREEAEPHRATGTQRTVQDACVTDGTEFFVTEGVCNKKSHDEI